MISRHVILHKRCIRNMPKQRAKARRGSSSVRIPVKDKSVIVLQYRHAFITSRHTYFSRPRSLTDCGTFFHYKSRVVLKFNPATTPNCNKTEMVEGLCIIIDFSRACAPIDSVSHSQDHLKPHDFKFLDNLFRGIIR